MISKKNIRLLIAAVLIICFAFGAMSLETLAADNAGAAIIWRMEGNTLIISGNGEMRDFTENDTPPWHKHRDNIRAVRVEAGVTSIGDLAFYKYESLTSVTIAKSVKSIGEYAFSDCESLAMISMTGVEHIGKSAFARCASLVNLRLPSTVKIIDDKAFYRCSGLESVSIPSSVTNIGNMVFTYCENLIGVTMYANVESVPEWTFYGCQSLSEVVLGESITGAENQAFYGCESFTSLYYPYSKENSLVEDIKGTSIETFTEQNLRGDTPTDNYLEGTSATVDKDLITQVNTTLVDAEGAAISIYVTTQTKFENGEFNEVSGSIAFDALIDGENGYDELISRILEAIESEEYGDSAIKATVRLQTGNNIPWEILSKLVGKNVQLTIFLPDGSVFGVDCLRLDLDKMSGEGNSFGCTVTPDPNASEKHKDVLEGAETYKVTYDADISQNFSNSIFVGKDKAYQIATIYVEDKNGELKKLQSVMIDKDGNATFYIDSISSGTEIVLGVNVKGETAADAIIPESIANDGSYILDRYRPIEYVITEEREFLGLNSWQFALVVFGVIAAIVIVVAVIAVIIFRKKRLALMQEMKKKKPRRA